MTGGRSGLVATEPAVTSAEAAVAAATGEPGEPATAVRPVSASRRPDDRGQG